MKFPKVLVIALGRINSADHYNNGLLMHNPFNNFPKENIAQICSSGDNGDGEFFQFFFFDIWKAAFRAYKTIFSAPEII